MKFKIGLLLIILFISSCGGNGVAVGNPDTQSEVGKQARITPSSGQGISDLFDLEFVENNQVLILRREKANPDNLLDETTVSYTEDDEGISFVLTVDENTVYGFLVVFDDSNNFVSINLTLNGEEVDLSFADTTSS